MQLIFDLLVVVPRRAVGQNRFRSVVNGWSSVASHNDICSFIFIFIVIINHNKANNLIAK